MNQNCNCQNCCMPSIDVKINIDLGSCCCGCNCGCNCNSNSGCNCNSNCGCNCGCGNNQTNTYQPNPYQQNPYQSNPYQSNPYQPQFTGERGLFHSKKHHCDDDDDGFFHNLFSNLFKRHNPYDQHSHKHGIFQKLMELFHSLFHRRPTKNDKEVVKRLLSDLMRQENETHARPVQQSRSLDRKPQQRPQNQHTQRTQQSTRPNQPQRERGLNVRHTNENDGNNDSDDGNLYNLYDEQSHHHHPPPHHTHHHQSSAPPNYFFGSSHNRPQHHRSLNVQNQTQTRSRGFVEDNAKVDELMNELFNNLPASYSSQENDQEYPLPDYNNNTSYDSYVPQESYNYQPDQSFSTPPPLPPLPTYQQNQNNGSHQCGGSCCCWRVKHIDASVNIN